ncbi:MAG: hypothetical protein ABIO79_01225 [Ferruginibacter sp.]
MNKIILSVLYYLLLSGSVSAQQKKLTAVDNFAEFTAGIGSSQGTGSLAYVYNWKLGKRQKIELGLGARFTSYFGSNLYFRTAPAKLTSGKTGPSVLFADDIDANIDSVLFPKAQINSLNLSLNVGYNFSKRFSAGITIDAIGFSFGKKQTGIYYGNNFATGIPVTAKPTPFNLLLISDNDQGSLNSELFARYKWNDSWGVKLGFQFLFAEYTTDSKVQTTPGGDKNDRFRKKMTGIAMGVTYNLK